MEQDDYPSGHRRGGMEEEKNGRKDA